jgi:hypothetical protein
MSFSTFISHQELVSLVANINLPFNPADICVELLAACGHTYLDYLFTNIGYNFYTPKAEEAIAFVDTPASDSQPEPVYPPYKGHFKTSEEATSHRIRGRTDEAGRLPKKANDLDYVKLYGREFWTRTIYEAMIDTSNISDTVNSIHRQRFSDPNVAGFEQKDLEAAAHNIFDACIKVHEQGWCYPAIYHKNVKRGNLLDTASDSVEKRLAQVCNILRESKAAVDDAIRGGLTLALLVDNPTARAKTKESNNRGNAARGDRLKFASKAKKMLDKKPNNNAETTEEILEQHAPEIAASLSPRRRSPSASRPVSAGVATGRITKSRANSPPKTQ